MGPDIFQAKEIPMSHEPENMRPVEAVRLAGRIRRIFGIELIVDSLRHITHKLNRLENVIMASKQEVLDALASDFKKIGDALQALKDGADANGKVEAADLDDIITAANAATDALLNPPAAALTAPPASA